MIKPKFIILFLGIQLISFQIYSQEVINLETYRNRALQNNENLSNAEKQLKQAEYQQKIQRSNYLPKISASGNYLITNNKFQYTLEEFFLPTYIFNPQTADVQPNLFINPLTGEPAYDLDGNPIFNQYTYIPEQNFSFDMNNSYLAGISAEQPIYIGGKIKTANKMADIGKDLREANVQLQIQQTITDADYYYWSYVAVNEKVELAKKYVQLLDSLVARVSNSVEAGLVHRNNLLKVQVKHNEAFMGLQKAENGLELLRMTLCHIMGYDLDANIIIADDTIEVPEILVTNSNEIDISNRADYLMLQKNVDLKSAEHNLVRSDFLPSVGLAANYNFYGGIKFNDNKYSGDGLSVIASVKIPLWQWGEGYNKLKIAKLETEIAETSLHKKSEMMQLEIQQSMNMVNEAISQYNTAKLNLEYSKENLQLSKDAYITGMEQITDYLEAQTQWQESYSNYIESKTNFKIQETMYYKTIGKLSNK